MSTEASASASASERGPEAEAKRRALDLARRGWGRVAPNPLVGPVVQRAGAVVGEGFHEEYGGPHPQGNALARAGEAAGGARPLLTLEPFAHPGPTPPCTDAI